MLGFMDEVSKRNPKSLRRNTILSLYQQLLFPTSATNSYCFKLLEVARESSVNIGKSRSDFNSNTYMFLSNDTWKMGYMRLDGGSSNSCSSCLFLQLIWDASSYRSSPIRLQLNVNHVPHFKFSVHTSSTVNLNDSSLREGGFEVPQR